MADIVIGQTVINRLGEKGTIISVDANSFSVDFKTRVAKFQHNAFDQKFLKYENADFQSVVDENINQAKIEEERIAEKRRLAAEKNRQNREIIKAKSAAGVLFDSITIRLDPAPLALSSVKNGDKELVKRVFDECDKDIESYHNEFNPQMKYFPNYSRSRYCTGFLTKYFDTYVLRVISRNDVYNKGRVGGVHVTSSDTTEIFRILFVNDKMYCFSKNLSFAGGNVSNTISHKKWHASDLANVISLDEIIRKCDCKYLNDYIEEKNINCLQYAKLLMPALHNNKAEIVFKHGLFASSYRIDNIIEYLEQYTSKQIDFACKNNAINALPMIKRYGLVDPKVVYGLEQAMIKRRNGTSIYVALMQIFERLHFDVTEVDKRLISFLKKLEYFSSAIYYDYIRAIAQRQGVTVADFFDKDYVERHNIMMLENCTSHSAADDLAYATIAEELSWINREENGYFIMVPKTILEFLYEGRNQHNCVYTNEYYRDVINHLSIIVFLRQSKDVSYVTVEFDYETFDVLQAYGKYNNGIDKDLYNYIVDLGKRLRHEKLSQQ